MHYLCATSFASALNERTSYAITNLARLYLPCLCIRYLLCLCFDRESNRGDDCGDTPCYERTRYGEHSSLQSTGDTDNRQDADDDDCLQYCFHFLTS